MTPDEDTASSEEDGNDVNL